jgi:MFS family permease
MLIALALSQTAAFLVRPALTYRALDLGADDVFVGVLVALYAFLPALLAIPLGRYSDIHRPTPVFAGGVALLALGAGGLTLAPELVSLTIATVVLGLGAMSIMVGSQSIVARIADAEHLDRDFGLTSAAVSVGQMLGPLVAGLVLGGSSRDPSVTWIAFALGAGLCLVALGFSLVYPDRRAPGVDDPPARLRDTAGVLRRPGVAPAMIASISLLTTVDLLVAYLPLIGERAGLGPAVVGLMLSLRGFASVLSRLIIGPLVRWAGRGNLIVASTAVTAVLVPVVALVQQPVLLGVILCVLGFFLGLGQPLTMTVITQSVPVGMRGAALAVRMVGNKSGQVALPVVLAGFTALGGLGSAFVALGVILAAAAVTSWRSRSATGGARVSAPPE